MMMLTGNANSPLYIQIIRVRVSVISFCSLLFIWCGYTRKVGIVLHSKLGQSVRWTTAESGEWRGGGGGFSEPLWLYVSIYCHWNQDQFNAITIKRERELYACARFVCVFIVLSYKKYRAFEPIKPRDGNKCVSRRTPIALKVANPLFWACSVADLKPVFFLSSLWKRRKRNSRRELKTETWKKTHNRCALHA